MLRILNGLVTVFHYIADVYLFVCRRSEITDWVARQCTILRNVSSVCLYHYIGVFVALEAQIST